MYHKTQDSTVKVDEGKKARDTWKTLDGCSDDTDAYGDLGCVEHRGCKDGTSLVWCEDPQQTKYPHDLDAAYRVPLWQWFDAMK